MTIRDIVISLGVELDQKSVNSVEGSLKGLKSSLSRILGAIGLTVSLTGINQMLEDWYSVNKVLNTLNTNLETTYDVQNKINDAANACRMSYTDMADAVNSLVKTGSKYFETAEDAADFLTLANQAFQVAGASESEISSLNNVLTTTFNTGKLSASGFNTIMSACPDIVEYLSNSLGMTTQQVKALGMSGSITAKQLKNALTNSADAISESYGNLSLTISDAVQIIKNNWGTWLEQMNETYDLTNTIANFLVEAFDWILQAVKMVVDIFNRFVEVLGSTERAVAVLTAAITALIAAFKWNKIVSGLNAIKTAMTGVTGQVIIIVGIVLVLILVISDLMDFMNGEDSVTGSIFEALGLDAESFRETLQRLWDMLTDLFDAIMPVLEELIDTILPIVEESLSIIVQVLVDLVEIAVDLLAVVIEIVSELVQALVPIIETILEAVQMLFEALKPLIDAVMQLINSVVELLGPLTQLLMDILEPILDIVQVLAKVLSAVLAVAFGIVGDVVQGIIDGPLQGVIEILQTIINFISAVFAGDWESAWKMLGNIPIAIINGIIGAFETFVNIFVDTINTITEALSSLWTWAGIPAIPEIPNVSFSRVAYLAEGGYIGANEPTPVVIGDNPREGEIVAPESKLRSSVLESLTEFFGSLNLGRGSQQSAVQTLQNQVINNITQNISIYNTFEGSKDVQKTASTAMKSSANDLVNELTIAMKYTR